MNDRVRRRSLIGPLLLIGIGVVFLMNNLGALRWNIWELILRFWPVLLIAAGLDLVIGRRSVWGSLAAVALLIGVVAFGLVYVQAKIPATDRSVERLAYPIQIAKRAEIRLSPGVGVIQLTRSASVTELLSGTTWVGGGMRVAREFSAEGDTALLNIYSEGPDLLFPAFGPPGRPTWDLQLTSVLPVSLSVDMGLGLAAVDLRGTRVYNFSLEQGVGQQVVYLPRNGIIKATLSTAIGETIVVIPPGVAARVHARTGIAARSIPASFARQGDEYFSPGYADAKDKVDLELDVAIGHLSIRVGTE